MKLNPIAQRFVLHWGEMGSKWGVNRTVSQIHALLYLAGRPTPADEITETLDVARSNVSNSIEELQNWNLIQMVHVLGDRRDRFNLDRCLDVVQNGGQRTQGTRVRSNSRTTSHASFLSASLLTTSTKYQYARSCFAGKRFSECKGKCRTKVRRSTSNDDQKIEQRTLQRHLQNRRLSTHQSHC